MQNYLHFGEAVAGYSVPVLNERQLSRAGILFVFALLNFLYAAMDFTQIFVTFFMLDFFIRVVINPAYAPSLIAGRFFVSTQTPEYIRRGAKTLCVNCGLILSIVMFTLIVILEMMTPIKIWICLACLILLTSAKPPSVFVSVACCIIGYFPTKLLTAPVICV